MRVCAGRRPAPSKNTMTAGHGPLPFGVTTSVVHDPSGVATWILLVVMTPPSEVRGGSLPQGTPSWKVSGERRRLPTRCRRYLALPPGKRAVALIEHHRT